MPLNIEATAMSPLPAVTCAGCGFSWNSATMAEGLRLLGSCPKCAGELVFRDVQVETRIIRSASEEPVAEDSAPHLVLGIPRR